MASLVLNYFAIGFAIKLHDWIIDQSGGMKGIKDSGPLESVLDHIQNDLYYPEFEDKLTHLVFGTIQFHPFNDGNKRSSILLGSYFLEINGFGYVVQKFVKEMENIVVWVAEGKISKEFLKELIASIIYDDEYPENLHFRLMLLVEDGTFGQG